MNKKYLSLHEKPMLTPDGWFITGKIAWIDEGGFLHLENTTLSS